MVTSSSVGDGFFEFLSDWDRFHLKVTPIQVVVPETRGYYLTTFDGRDVVKVMLTGTIVQVWRVTTTAPISANLHHLIREYTGD